MKIHFARTALALAFSLSFAGCSDDADHEGGKTTTTTTTTTEVGPSARAEIQPVAGSSVTGEAIFETLGEEVTLTVTIEGASEGEHGIHIHEFGTCGDDGKDAGEHWNPTGEMHGLFGSDAFHLGDIGNITVGPDGRGELELTTDLWTVGDGAPTDVTNLAIIFHERPDDYVTQPSGDTGAALGCGVITVE